ncbi:MAG: MFS transporter, partial [Rhodoferax sp.]
MKAMTQGRAIAIFVAFACAYFISTLIRAITATLAPTLMQEFALNARDLGLLAGGYFLGFASIQLPLGAWLDRHGPKKVVLCFLSVAVLGCAAFAWASGFAGLVAARMLSGLGVSACLMAPLTGYRRWYAPGNQMRANSWMLMVGAMGMVAATLPVQWLLPLVGWRPLFLGLGALVMLAMLLILWQVPAWGTTPVTPLTATENPPVSAATPALAGYAQVWRNPYFRRLAPLGFCNYGGMVAMQTLWAGPWMAKVAGYSPTQSAMGLFWINVAMLLAYWMWAMLNPWLTRRHYGADRLITYGIPLTLLILATLVAVGDTLPTWSTALLLLYCVA